VSHDGKLFALGVGGFLAYVVTLDVGVERFVSHVLSLDFVHCIFPLNVVEHEFSQPNDFSYDFRIALTSSIQIPQSLFHPVIIVVKHLILLIIEK